MPEPDCFCWKELQNLLPPCSVFAGSSQVFCYHHPLFAGTGAHLLLICFHRVLFLLDPANFFLHPYLLEPGSFLLPPYLVFVGSSQFFCYNRCCILLHCISQRRGIFATIGVRLCYNQRLELRQCKLQPASWLSGEDDFCWNRCLILLERALIFAGTGDRYVTTVRCNR